MSLPGVESARRRRVSHGRSSIGFVQPPPLRRRSIPHPPATPAYFNPPIRFLDAADHQHREILNERALAARHRLDERLRDLTSCTPQTINRRHDEASSISRPMVVEPRANEKRVLMSEEKVVEKVGGGGSGSGGGQQDDCPVCLDSFVAGQTVVHLPCHHTFHSDCIVPWLRHHCHCPSCRAKIS